MRIEANSVRKIRPWAGVTFPAIKPATKKDIQLLRKLWHVIMMGSIALAYATVIPSKEFGLILIAVLGGPLVLLDILRLRWKNLNRVALFLFGPFMRKRELATFSGMGFFIIGLFIVVALFPKPLAILAILCLTFGDPAACIVGIKFGKDILFNGKKSLQGSLACFSVCTILTYVVLHAYGVSSDYLLLISLLGGLTATLAELCASKKIDDNFSIPVMTATVLYPILSLLTDIF